MFRSIRYLFITTFLQSPGKSLTIPYLATALLLDLPNLVKTVLLHITVLFGVGRVFCNRRKLFTKPSLHEVVSISVRELKN